MKSYRDMTSKQLVGKRDVLADQLAKGVIAAKYPAVVWCLREVEAELKARWGR